ncbi:MAG: hypothetical protein M0Q25_08685 [Sulfurospirillaceae bacterium]|nr:hypothetical protein [Sulfurospirillaceae bacterium]
MKRLLIPLILSCSLLLAENQCDNVFTNATTVNYTSFENFPYGQNIKKIDSLIIYQNGYGKYFLETIDNKPLLDTRIKIEVKKYIDQYYVFVDFVPCIFSEPAIYKFKRDNLELLCKFKYKVIPYCLNCKDKELAEYIKTCYIDFSNLKNDIKIDFDNDGQIDNLKYIDDISGGICDYLSYRILNKNNLEITEYIFEKYNILINKCSKKIYIFSFNNKNYIYVENDDFSSSVHLIENGLMQNKNDFNSNVLIIKVKE